MSERTTTDGRRPLSPLLRGLFFLFDRREGPSYPTRAGLRLLVVVVVLELVIGPRAHILELFDLPQPPAWLRTGTLLIEALAATKLWANVQLRDIGFLSPFIWTATERVYAAEIVVGASLAFIFLRGHELGLFRADATAWITFTSLIGPQLLWGFYQEVVYRGLLQTELTRRWGGLAGGLIANLAFTLGPLHFYHLANLRPETTTATLVIIGSTFLVGIMFAFIFHRTRNIWIVGLLHGIGNAFMNTTGGMGT